MKYRIRIEQISPEKWQQNEDGTFTLVMREQCHLVYEQFVYCLKIKSIVEAVLENSLMLDPREEVTK